MAAEGNPAAYFTRLKRSSSTAAIRRPSAMIAAEALPWYALIPRMYIRSGFPFPQDLRPRVRGSRGSRGGVYGIRGRDWIVRRIRHVVANPFIEHEQAPGTRPIGLADDEVLPRAP